MLPLAKVSVVIEHYAPYFTVVFSPEAFLHFKRLLSGLLLNENKTIEAINRLFFLETKHANSLNYFINHSPFDLAHLNECRLELLQDNERTKMKSEGRAAGVLIIDDTLLEHYGKKIEGIHKLYDHVKECYVYAHNLVTLHYSDDHCDYPIYHELWLPMNVEKMERKMEALNIRLNEKYQNNKTTKPAEWRRYLMNRYFTKISKTPQLREVYETKLHIAQRQIQRFYQEQDHQRLPVTFDIWYTQPQMCHFIDQKLGKSYVGQLKSDEELILSGSRHLSLEVYTKELIEQHYDNQHSFRFQKTTVPYKGSKEVYYTYCATRSFDRFGKQRLVISFSNDDDFRKANPRFFITNRKHWNASGICRISRHRWPVEVFHQEGKAEGLDQYQLRNFTAIQRHIALVVVVYSILQRARYDDTLLPKLQYQLESELLGSLANWRRLFKANAFYDLVDWIYSSASTEASSTADLNQLLRPLMQTIAYS